MTSPLAELDGFAPGLLGELASVDGVVGVALGGSRARGEHRPTSDYDLGIYYRDTLDIAHLQQIADTHCDQPSAVTDRGAWGPWVDGGAWLEVGGQAVDLIYRDLGRVIDVWDQCRQGRFTNERQNGHPLGFWSHSYAGELALALLLHTDRSPLAPLRAQMQDYPEPLSAALRAALWESSFTIEVARKGAERADGAYVLGCLFRAAGVMAQALHGHEGRWLLNEKGAIGAAGRLPSAPPDLAARVQRAFTTSDGSPASLIAACDQLQTIVAETEAAIS